jgi:hypothetical protein
MTLWTVTNPLSASPQVAGVEFPVGSYLVAPDASQCGGAHPIETDDARLLDAIYRDGSLWTAHTIACPSDTTKACARFVRVNPFSLGVLDDFAYGAPSAGYHYYYPAITTDGSNNVYAVFNRSSSSECVGIHYAGRLNTEPANTLQPSTPLQVGAASFVSLDDFGSNLWGYYSGIAPDPVNTDTAWIAGAYALALNTWATWIGQASFSAPPSLTGLLENPHEGSLASGVSVISGWKCTAGTVTVQIDDGPLLTAAYGTLRTDTHDVCGDDNNGFGLLWNWNKFTDGSHTIRVFDNGVQFDSATFTVATLGQEFLRGMSGRYTLPNFPQPGQNVVIIWQESLQNFTIEGMQ